MVISFDVNITSNGTPDEPANDGDHELQPNDHQPQPNGNGTHVDDGNVEGDHHDEPDTESKEPLMAKDEQEVGGVLGPQFFFSGERRVWGQKKFKNKQTG